jgi:hypothetical protein
MKKSIFVAVAAIVAFLFQETAAISGKAVTVVTYMLTPYWGQQPTAQSRLIVSTISANVCTKTDTLLTGGLFFMPTWNFDATRIAFYRNSASGGANVSVVDANGGNLRNVATLTTAWGEWDNETHISWPAADGGKWIYYHTSGANYYRKGTGEIWKVNINDTTQRVLVCDYKKLDNISPGDISGPGLWRWSLSADAKYSVCHTNGTVASMGYQPGIICHTFPPQDNNPRLTMPVCEINGGCGVGDCNSALSPTGNIMYHFRGGHCQLYANYWNHAAKTLSDPYTIGTDISGTLGQYKDVETWLSAADKSKIGSTFIYPRGSVNSDRVVSMITGYIYGDRYTAESAGSNHLIVNWKAKEAVYATNNREAPHPNGVVPDGNYFWFSEPGHFWVDGGAANAGKIENVDGTWSTVDQTPLSINDRYAAIPAIHGIHGSISVYSLKGSRIGNFDRRVFEQQMSKRLPQGAYVVRSRSLPGKTMMLSNGDLTK